MTQHPRRDLFILDAMRTCNLIELGVSLRINMNTAV
jgi:hypothetical protein